MTTTQTTQESLAALLEAAPPELREALTSDYCRCAHYEDDMNSYYLVGGAEPIYCDGCSEEYHPERKAFQHLTLTRFKGHGDWCDDCHGGRATLPVPEATLAAIQWWPMSADGRVVYIRRVSTPRGPVLRYATEAPYVFKYAKDYPDIFAAIRAALEAK